MESGQVNGFKAARAVDAAYARVSSKEQAADGNALKQQIARLEAKGVERIYCDVLSGTKSDRPQFRQLITDIKRGEIRKVYCARVNRLGRHGPTLRMFRDLVLEYGVHFISLDECIDLNTSAGKAQYNMLAVFAEQYSDDLSEKIGHGFAFSRKQLRVAHAPLGYKKNQEKHLILDVEPTFEAPDGTLWSRAEIGRAIAQNYIEERSLNKTVRWIYAIFGEPFFSNSSSLRRWLSSPVLRGHTVYFPKSDNPEIHHHTHEPLLEAWQSEQIMATIAHNRKVGKFGAGGKYLLTGLVKCTCGAGCVISNGSGGKKKYFICHASRSGRCRKKKWTPMPVIEQYVFEQLANRANELANFAAQPQKAEEPPEIAVLCEKLATFRAMPSDPVIESAIASYESQIEQLKATQSTTTEIDMERVRLLQWAFGRVEAWEQFEHAKKRELLLQLLDYVSVNDGEIVGIKFKF